MLISERWEVPLRPFRVPRLLQADQRLLPDRHECQPHRARLLLGLPSWIQVLFAHCSAATLKA